MTSKSPEDLTHIDFNIVSIFHIVLDNVNQKETLGLGKSVFKSTQMSCVQRMSSSVEKINLKGGGNNREAV